MLSDVDLSKWSKKHCKRKTPRSQVLAPQGSRKGNEEQTNFCVHIKRTTLMQEITRTHMCTYITHICKSHTTHMKEPWRTNEGSMTHIGSGFELAKSVEWSSRQVNPKKKRQRCSSILFNFRFSSYIS